jgi:hypothetical protein
MQGAGRTNKELRHNGQAAAKRADSRLDDGAEAQGLIYF